MAKITADQILEVALSAELNLSPTVAQDWADQLAKVQLDEAWDNVWHWIDQELAEIKADGCEAAAYEEQAYGRDCE